MISDKLMQLLTKMLDARAIPENADAIVCMTLKPGDALLLPDNLTARCAWGCGNTVQFRPNVPSHIPRVCIPCAMARATGDN